MFKIHYGVTLVELPYKGQVQGTQCDLQSILIYFWINNTFIDADLKKGNIDYNI